MKKRKSEIQEPLSFESLKELMDAHYSEVPWDGEVIPLDQTKAYGKEETDTRPRKKKSGIRR